MQEELLHVDEPIYSVEEVTQRITAAISSEFSGLPIWVRGEISNYRGRNQKGHMYFSLKDERATLPLVFFAGKNAQLDFEPDEGMAVIACGQLNVYAPHGRYQLIVERLLPEGRGKLFLQFEKLKRKLDEQGLFAAATKQPLPAFPVTLGIVTSPTGAVIRDILKIVQKRYPAVRVLVAPAQVQGEQAAASIVKAIERLHRCQQPQVDTIILARGGGSIEDLWPFNEEAVARAIFAAKIPIISAVGHETDFTISDFVADVRAATPTHAAELALPNCEELLRELDHTGKRLLTAMEQELELAKEAHQRFASATVFRFPEKFIVDRQQMLDRLCEQLDFKIGDWLHTRRASLLAPAQRLVALNPLQVLQRGFALAQKPSGPILQDASKVKRGEPIVVRLHRGSLDCKVEQTHKGKPRGC